jgi:hypothetical protein
MAHAHDTQRLLFAGLTCLPDQLDLFETDGQPEPAPRSPDRDGGPCPVCNRITTRARLFCSPECEQEYEATHKPR